MTVGQVMEQFHRLFPHQYPDQTLLGWLSELEGQAIGDIFLTRCDNPAPAHWCGYGCGDRDRTLLIPAPYDGVYLDWLKSKVDYWNGDSAGYHDSYSAFNNAYLSFGDAWRRSHAPAKQVRLSL